MACITKRNVISFFKSNIYCSWYCWNTLVNVDFITEWLMFQIRRFQPNTEHLHSLSELNKMALYASRWTHEVEYKGVSKSFRTEPIKKYALTKINSRWEAPQGVMAAKLTRLADKIAIQLHLVAESCTIGSSCSRRPVRKLLDTPS
jgi:hypothetical protein